MSAAYFITGTDTDVGKTPSLPACCARRARLAKAPPPANRLPPVARSRPRACATPTPWRCSLSVHYR